MHCLLAFNVISLHLQHEAPNSPNHPNSFPSIRSGTTQSLWLISPRMAEHVTLSAKLTQQRNNIISIGTLLILKYNVRQESTSKSRAFLCRAAQFITALWNRITDATAQNNWRCSKSHIFTKSELFFTWGSCLILIWVEQAMFSLHRNVDSQPYDNTLSNKIDWMTQKNVILWRCTAQISMQGWSLGSSVCECNKHSMGQCASWQTLNLEWPRKQTCCIWPSLFMLRKVDVLQYQQHPRFPSDLAGSFRKCKPFLRPQDTLRQEYRSL